MDEEQINASLPEIRAGFEKTFKAQIDSGKFDADDVTRFRQDDTYAKCFLRSFTEKDKDMGYTLDKTEKVFLYRKEIELNSLTKESFSSELLDRGFLYWKGVNKEDQKILIFKVSNAKKGQLVDQTKKFIAFTLDQYQKAEPGVRIAVIFDFTGAGVTNVDMDVVKYIISCFTNHFPSLLSYILLYEMPMLMSAVWRVIQSWLSEAQKKKIKLVKKKDLPNYIEADQLEAHMK